MPPIDRSSGAKKTASTMTFRLDDDVLDELRKESQNKEISLNTLANQILRQHVIWDIYLSKVGMIPIAKPVVSAIFEKMTDSDINDLASNVGKDAVRDIVLFMEGTVNVDSYLSWFELRMKNSFVEVNHVKRGTSHTFVMKHDLGYNWSLYHKKLLDITFYEIFKIPIKIRITNSTLSFDIKE
jgi:hypothetical protein